MTISELIKKIGLEIQRKEDKEKSPLKNLESYAAYGTLKYWYEEMQHCEKQKELNYYDAYITGMLYGLHAVYYISDAERMQLLNELDKVYVKSSEMIEQKLTEQIEQKKSVLEKLGENKKVLDSKDSVDRPVEQSTKYNQQR